MQEIGHLQLAVEHGFVHVDVDHLCAAFHLVAGDGQRFLIIFFANQAGEFLRSAHIGAFADINKIASLICNERLQPAEAELLWQFRNHARLSNGCYFGESQDMIGRGAATAPNNIDETTLDKTAQLLRHGFGRLVVFAKLVGQAGVGIHADKHGCFGGKFRQVGPHLFGAECAIEADAEQISVRNGNEKRLSGLPGKRASAGIGDGAGDH